MPRLTPEMIEMQMELCDRDYAYAASLGPKKVSALVYKYMALHPSWSTNGVFDERTYERANAVMGHVFGMRRTAKAQRRMRQQEKRRARRQQKVR